MDEFRDQRNFAVAQSSTNGFTRWMQTKRLAANADFSSRLEAEGTGILGLRRAPSRTIFGRWIRHSGWYPNMQRRCTEERGTLRGYRSRDAGI